jgi:hypothetical protein
MAPTSQQNPMKEHEDFIREAAAARGIDPDIAVKVAKSEGLGHSFMGDQGTSSGDWQLHQRGGSGVSSANQRPGLGDEFAKKYGPPTQANWKQQTEFSLDQALKGGWGPWHGAGRVGIGKWQGLPKPSWNKAQSVDDMIASA